MNVHNRRVEYSYTFSDYYFRTLSSTPGQVNRMFLVEITF